MSDSNNVPAGFTVAPKPTEQQRIAAVEYTALSDGVTVRFVRTESFTAKGRAQTLHIFHGKREFAVWGCGLLDYHILGKVKPGTVCYIKYAGKIPHPTDDERTVHDFIFAVQGKPAPAPAGAAVDAAEDLPF